MLSSVIARERHRRHQQHAALRRAGPRQVPVRRTSTAGTGGPRATSATPCSPPSTPSTRSTRFPTSAASTAGPTPTSPRPPASTPAGPISASPTDRSSSSKTRSARWQIANAGGTAIPGTAAGPCGSNPPAAAGSNGYPIGLSRDAQRRLRLHAEHVRRRLPSPGVPQRRRGHQLRPVLSDEAAAASHADRRAARCSPQCKRRAQASPWLFFFTDSGTRPDVLVATLTPSAARVA